jgi:crotonobetainyl-CoA:carnitine CoA-transferase CaiB-like acyl-CoA transferase
MSAPLEGIRVLDLTRFVSGPHATQMLADYGADVVKVEPPGVGDPTRLLDRMVGEPDSLFAITLNRGKRSLALDLYSDAGKAVLTDLIKAADVMVENFRPGTLEQMGFGWDELHALNPRLILVRISGFGQDGPWAKRAAYDPVIQALSGLQALTGAADGPPTVAGTIITDYLTGLHAVIGTTTALQARERSGKGQWVDVSMLDGTTSLLNTVMTEYLMFGREKPRQGNKNPVSVPSHTFPCGCGGYVHITAANDSDYRKICTVMGRPDLANDPRFATMEARKVNYVACEQTVTDWTLTMDAATVECLLLEQRLASAKVATIRDVAENPQLAHRGHFIEVEHPIQGKIPVTGPALRFSDMPPREDRRIPLAGEHSDEVLAEWLGYDAEQLTALHSIGVTGHPVSREQRQ